jgi:hypothetical protein
MDAIPWLGAAVNVLTLAYVAGIVVQRVNALEKRMDSKGSKDDARDAVLTQIRIDIAGISQKLDNLPVRTQGQGLKWF